jgi:hypothetical protein
VAEKNEDGPMPAGPSSDPLLGPRGSAAALSAAVRAGLREIAGAGHGGTENDHVGHVLNSSKDARTRQSRSS